MKITAGASVMAALSAGSVGRGIHHPSHPHGPLLCRPLTIALRLNWADRHHVLHRGDGQQRLGSSRQGLTQRARPSGGVGRNPPTVADLD